MAVLFQCGWLQARRTLGLFRVTRNIPHYQNMPFQAGCEAAQRRTHALKRVFVPQPHGP